ncbi:family 20 glycosylhydrolase [Thalassotalea fonticola]|uniref:Family 20 glycosylhydrolase n=1 Tax=Thalassotalea fonticola TaxID=3065649 RepID=A0ABZ0GIQ8_9GAMM|nr:family 20 glycosylhydrolase [Colwelliaceae bacterium S1-1]
MNIIHHNGQKPLFQRQLNVFPILALLLLVLTLPFSKAHAANSQDDFSVVAYHVDLRVQVMPMPALKAMAKEVSELGFNTLIMEWEATYPYQQHSIISNRYAYSREEVADFIKYSESLGLDVIPLQQNLGHSEYILMHERYAYLRADKRDLSQVDPTRLKQARKLFTELYRDMLSTHNSQYVHIGGDEARILDCDRCKKAWGKDGEELGKSKLYVEYMKMIAEIVTAEGKTPLLWADMILAHPEAIADMPKNVIYIDWNYGWKFDRFGEDPMDMIEKHGLKFWGASSIRSAPDDYHVTSWDKHMKNQADYVAYAKQAGFEGMVLTSWSTSGQYGYQWFGYEVVELFPIRQVYPHSYPNDAFRMNTQAFIEAINAENVFVPQDFSEQYAKQRFGLSSDQASKLWNILTSADLNNKIGVGSRAMSGREGLSAKQRIVTKNLQSVRALQAELSKIIVQKNQEEFAHYQLQVDFREFYLTFRQIQDVVQSTTFSEKDRVLAVQQLEQLLARASELNKRFNQLFKGAIFDSEMVTLNQYRNKKIIHLHQRLTKQR